MFKKLKEKITEEVKISPQRFADFTQSVTDRLQNNSTSDENFFSIGDDDANTSKNSLDNSNGFSSVSLVSPTQEMKIRRNSNSSMASDVSFLPRYESGSMYHLQSDLDASASEMEDNASTSSSQLGHLTKEQIYSAFQKSQMRYHKYRGRYTDLTRHYKNLERENGKMKSVLVETQDKAIRRVTELKEQCSLEQKAKAHLDRALRDELDEKNFKIQTLQTKVSLLQNPEQNSALLVDIGKESSQTDLETLTKYLNDARKEIETLNTKNQELKANLIVFQSKETEYKSKLSKLENQLQEIEEEQKENNLKLAQTKMELHNEIITKDSEISNLKKFNEVLKQNLETSESEDKSNKNVKLENLQSQNAKLIEKLEKLTLRCSSLESELYKVETYKIEIEELKKKETQLNEQIMTSKSQKQAESNDLIKSLTEENEKLKKDLELLKTDHINELNSFREEAKLGLLSLEPKIREKLSLEFSKQKELLQREFEEKLEKLMTNNESFDRIKVQLLERDDLIGKMENQLQSANDVLSEQTSSYSNLEQSHLELIEDCGKLRKQIETLENGKSDLENSEERMGRLEAHISTLQEETESLSSICDRKEIDNISLTEENLKLKENLSETSKKLRLLEEKNETIGLEHTECKLLTMKLRKLEAEKTEILSNIEMERKMFNDLLEDRKELKEKEDVILGLEETVMNLREELNHFKDRFAEESEKTMALYEEKLNLEKIVEKLQTQIRVLQEKDAFVSVNESECDLLELKLQKLEEEKKNLLESFELERKTFKTDLENIKFVLSNEKTQKDGPIRFESSDEVLREKLLELEHLSVVKEKDFICLAQENKNLNQEKRSLSEKLRLLEEKLESIEIEETECKLLEIKVQNLEQEKHALFLEFEKERKMFNDLLENHKEVQVKESLIKELENDLNVNRSNLRATQDFLSEEKSKNICLQEEKLVLEKEIEKMKEQIRLSVEKQEVVEMDKNESGILEIKLQKLESEKAELLKTFENERSSFNEAYHNLTLEKKDVKALTDENLRLKSELKVLTEKIQEKCDSFEDLNKFKDVQTALVENLKQKLEEKESEVKILSETINLLKKANDDIKIELGNKDVKNSELSKDVSGLKQEIMKQSEEFNNLLGRTKELDLVLDKFKNEASNSLEKEKSFQKELLVQIDDLKKDLQEKCVILEEKKQEKSTETELKTKLTSVGQNLKISEQEKIILIEEKENLLSEIGTLRSKIEELISENSNLTLKQEELSRNNAGFVELKSRNEQLQNAFDNLKKETSEMSLRINQISSDNKTILDENQSLIQDKEDLKVKLELSENEKKDFDNVKDSLLEEKEDLNKKIEQLKSDLSEIQRQNLELIDIKNKNMSLDADKIEKSFYEVKEQYDGLLVENKTLKSLCAKLEENSGIFEESRRKFEAQIRDLENQYSEIIHEKQLLQDEIQELKISPLNVKTNVQKLNDLQLLHRENDHSQDEDSSNKIASLREKLVQYKSLDLTNKSSIEFYEHELEKVKNQNEKLKRKLDETLVTLNHCAELSSSTEVEYLKNVLYNYMLGKESLVLARVIAAVCKFDPQQTETVMQKEQQKQTLLGQLGLI